VRYELTKYLNRHNIEGFSLSQLKYKYATCRDARALLLRKDPNEDTPRCIDCHTQALQRYKDGELKRINNANTIKKRILKNL